MSFSYSFGAFFMSTETPSPRRLFRWTRDLHLYAGLFLSPFLLVFAVSTLVLNHPDKSRTPAAEVPLGEHPVTLDTRMKTNSVEQAKAILRQLNLTGEIDVIRYNAKASRLTLPIVKPGEITTVDVDLNTNRATVQRRVEGMLAGLVYLHMRPGQHLVMLRGNWAYMAAWTRFADAAVYGTIFLTASGLYLWWFFKAERRIGWALLAAGFLSVGALAATLAG
jgi:hypothetical protein